MEKVLKIVLHLWIEPETLSQIIILKFVNRQLATSPLFNELNVQEADWQPQNWGVRQVKWTQLLWIIQQLKFHTSVLSMINITTIAATIRPFKYCSYLVIGTIAECQISICNTHNNTWLLARGDSWVNWQYYLINCNNSQTLKCQKLFIVELVYYLKSRASPLQQS